MIKSPKTILRFLKGKTVKVHRLKKDTDGRQLLGWTDYRTNVIHIHKDQPVERRISSLIHESLHRLNDHYQKQEHEYMIEGYEKEIFDKLTTEEYNSLREYVV